MSIPRLVTEHLVLRGFEEGDLDAYAVMMADPAVTRYLGDGRPMSRADAWRQMAMLMGHWSLRGFGIWAVEERESGAFAGRIGCFEPEGWPGFEVAYTLAPAFHGRGYATEGARAALEFARTTLGRSRVISVIRPDNVASQRVAGRLGATLEGSVELFGAPARIYVYPPPAVALDPRA